MKYSFKLDNHGKEYHNLPKERLKVLFMLKNLKINKKETATERYMVKEPKS